VASSRRADIERMLQELEQNHKKNRVYLMSSSTSAESIAWKEKITKQFGARVVWINAGVMSDMAGRLVADQDQLEWGLLTLSEAERLNSAIYLPKGTIFDGSFNKTRSSYLLRQLEILIYDESFWVQALPQGRVENLGTIARFVERFA
jgi:hypothetical protein